ncbi:MAG TPA: SCP2 sterol-binding domain-containing protein [Acidimicrobiia bacterium]
MVEFLSAKWIAALDAAARASTTLRSETDEIVATVEQVIVDAPAGAVRYHVRIDHGDVRVHAGPADAPDVTFIADYEVARAINEGSTTAQEALAAGRLKVTGGLARLVGHEAALTAVGDVFAGVRAATTYADLPG